MFLACLFYIFLEHVFYEIGSNNGRSNIYVRTMLSNLYYEETHYSSNSCRYKSINHPIILQDLDIDRFWTNLETKTYRVLRPYFSSCYLRKCNISLSTAKINVFGTITWFQNISLLTIIFRGFECFLYGKEDGSTVCFCDNWSVALPGK